MIALIFVCMDGLNWFVHLANHRVRMLWRFHELHHSQEDMNALTVFRTHPFLHVSYLLALIPGVVLLTNGAVSTSVLIAYAAFVAFAHSNTNLGFGPLRRIFVSPNYHRIHHRRDGAQDVNLGFALTIWTSSAPGGLSRRDDDRDRHRSARTPAAGRTGRASSKPPERPLVSAHRAVPSDDRASRPALHARDPIRPEDRMTTAVQETTSAARDRNVGHLVRAVFSVRPASVPADLGLLAARIGLAWIFIYYGAGKLFGAFNGPGIHRTALYFSNTAHLHPGGFFAVLGGLIEFGGGLAMAVGLLTRLAGLALLGDMVMAMITVTWATGIDPANNGPGYQLNLALAVLALAVALLGAGRFSLDAMVGRRLAGTTSAAAKRP